MFKKADFRKVVKTIASVSTVLTIASINHAAAGDNEVRFELTDNPGSWFDTGSEVAGSRSIAIASPGVRV